MKTAVIYGASQTGKSVYLSVKDKYNVSYFVDGNPALIGKKNYELSIYEREHIFEETPDIVVMGILTRYEEAILWLVEKGFPEERIVTSYIDLPHRARYECVKKMAVIIEKNKIPGAVAELGVYRGDFAKQINEIFSKRKIYLFDTFEGFTKEDMDYEKNNNLLLSEVGNLANTSVDYVMSKMTYPDMCIIKKGYFPETTEGIEDKFAFVNIDADLYKPILAGLEYFWPRMEDGGYILVHDYFSLSYAGAPKAIDEFSEKYGVGFVPVGDTLSVAFVKKGDK